MLKKWRIPLALASAATVVLLIVLTRQFDGHSIQETLSSAGSRSAQLTKTSINDTAPGNSTESTPEKAAAISNVSKQPDLLNPTPVHETVVRRPTPPGILGGGNLRKLYASADLTNLDYAWSRLTPICNMALNQARERDKVLAKLSSDAANNQKLSPRDPYYLSVGNASYQQRLIALDRFYELCNKSFDGTPLTSEELTRVSAQPSAQKYRAIASAASVELIDLNNVKIREALTTVVTTPMYDTLQGILLTKLDTSPLSVAYSPEQIESFKALAAQILVCRLGDDCGPDGYTTLFTCRLNGICGNNYEDAVWDHLQARNIDTRAFRQFIDQRYQALSLLDFSILKRSK